ncbi:MAG: PilZ domain-containing protein [Mariprofundaceae bacterium]
MMKNRTFIRHPSGIPIDAQPIDQSDTHPTSMLNISEGGLAFETHEQLPVGAVISIKIPHIDLSFHVTGKVIWTNETDQGFSIGVIFTDKDEAFRARMVQQVCHIESYWRKTVDSGRELTIEDAASEWIRRFATDFPQQH